MVRTAVVTGAASGIGKATATGLARHGFHVTLVVRSQQKGEAAMVEIRGEVAGAKLGVLVCDLASQDSIRRAAKSYLRNHPTLDVLVHCAGVFLPDRQTTPDGLEATFATNVVAYYLLTKELLPALRKAAPSRVVFVASKYGRTTIPFDDLQTANRAYSFLKSTPPTMLGRVLVMQEFATRLAADGITVNAVHPGLVRRTSLLKDVGGFFRWITNTFGTSHEKGADTVVWLATSPEAEGKTGIMWHKRRPIKTSGQGSDPAVRARYWAELERLTAPAGAA